MPNWTTTRMVVHENDLPAILNDDGEVDFNLVDPMPESLNVQCGAIGEIAMQLAWAREGGRQGSALAKMLPDLYRRELADEGRISYFDGVESRSLHGVDEIADLGDVLVANSRVYGYSNWYDWCCSDEHWGTKWNADDTRVEKNGRGVAVVQFNTAWNAPSEALCAKIAEACRHPVRMEHADEDFDGVYLTDFRQVGGFGDGGTRRFEATRDLRSVEECGCYLFDVVPASDGDYEWEDFEPRTPSNHTLALLAHDGDDRFNYMLLDRLKSDCDFFLDACRGSGGNSDDAQKFLWAGSVERQINEMRSLMDTFNDNLKPEWLTDAQIDEYERRMSPSPERAAKPSVVASIARGAAKASAGAAGRASTKIGM